MWHTLLPLQEWGGHDSLTKIIMNITITNFLSHSRAFIFMIEFSGRSSRALLVRCKNWQHLHTIQIYRVPCLLMMPSTQESNGNWAKCCYFSNNKKQREACYSIGSVALDWSVTFYKFAKVDLILIADSTIRWQAPVCIIIRGGITARSFYIWSFKTSRHWTIYNIVDYSWTFSNSIGIYSKMG